MCGSGTTCKMAKLNGRNYIGSEISEEYCKIAEERLKNCQSKLL
jgi:DNA modification methylase